MEPGSPLQQRPQSEHCRAVAPCRWQRARVAACFQAQLGLVPVARRPGTDRLKDPTRPSQATARACRDVAAEDEIENRVGANAVAEARGSASHDSGLGHSGKAGRRGLTYGSPAEGGGQGPRSGPDRSRCDAGP